MDFSIPEDQKPTYSDSLSIGSKYDPVESGVYKGCTVTEAYLHKDKNNIVKQHMCYEVNGSEVSESFVVMKNGKQTEVDSKTNKEKLLWGRAAAAEVNFLIASMDIDAITKNQKVIQLYDFEQGGKVDTTVVELAELIGKPIDLAILKTRRNKMKKVGDKFVATPDENIGNRVKKHARTSDGKTMAEIKANTDAEFMTEWANTYKGKTLDQYKPVQGAATPPSSPASDVPWDNGTSNASGSSAPAVDDPFA